MSKIGAPSKGDYLGGGGKGHFLHRSKIPRRLCAYFRMRQCSSLFGGVAVTSAVNQAQDESFRCAS